MLFISEKKNETKVKILQKSQKYILKTDQV